MPRVKTSSAMEVLVTLDRRRRRAPPPPARAGAAARDPVGPPGTGDVPALQPRARLVAGRVARDRRGGLRAARRGGLPGHHARGDDAGRRDDLRRARGPRAGGAGAPSGRRLPNRPARPRRVPARRVAAVAAQGHGRRPLRPARLPGRTRGAGAPVRARGLPQPRARDLRGAGQRGRDDRLRPGSRAARGRPAHDGRRPAGDGGPVARGQSRVRRVGRGRGGGDPRGRRRHPGRRAGGLGRGRRAGHRGAPVPDRVGPAARAAGGPGGLGGAATAGS